MHSHCLRNPLVFYDAFGNPEVLPQIRDQYQVEFPTLSTESDYPWLTIPNWCCNNGWHSLLFFIGIAHTNYVGHWRNWEHFTWTSGTSWCQIIEFIEPTHAKAIGELVEPLHKIIFSKLSLAASFHLTTNHLALKFVLVTLEYFKIFSKTCMTFLIS